MSARDSFAETKMSFNSDDEAPVTPLPSGKLPSYIKEHRKRLRKRFMIGGAEAVPEYELLELVLFRSLPRGDVKPLANKLLKKFGDINRVLAASPSQLKEIEGVGDEITTDIKIIEAVAHRMARARIKNKQVISSWDALLDYCHTSMSHRPIEHFRILFLDTKNNLISDELQAEGTVDHVPVYPRKVVKRCLELDASSFILVHNHPTGDPSPSEADISMTYQIQAAAETLNLTLHDHLIIGQNKEISFRSKGYL